MQITGDSVPILQKGEALFVGLDGGLIHADVDELLQRTVGSDHPKSGVLRPRDIPCA